MLYKLEKKTCHIGGVMIEDNRFCISVHYRHVKQQDYEILEKQVEMVLKEYPKFHMTRGKNVLEIRPSIKWNKGHALKYLLETLGFTNPEDKDDVVPVYIGDDKTDEDAFKVLKSKGAGFPIIVTSKPRETAASYSSSSVMNFQTEPPSNQRYRGNKSMLLWPAEERMAGLKRSYPFSIDDAPVPSFNCRFPPTYASLEQMNQHHSAMTVPLILYKPIQF